MKTHIFLLENFQTMVVNGNVDFKFMMKIKTDYEFSWVVRKKMNINLLLFLYSCYSLMLHFCRFYLYVISLIICTWDSQSYVIARSSNFPKCVRFKVRLGIIVQLVYRAKRNVHFFVDNWQAFLEENIGVAWWLYCFRTIRTQQFLIQHHRIFQFSNWEKKCL